MLWQRKLINQEAAPSNKQHAPTKHSLNKQ